jgi:hypothetical protein
MLPRDPDRSMALLICMFLAFGIAVSITASLAMALTGDKYAYGPLRVSLAVGGSALSAILFGLNSFAVMDWGVGLVPASDDSDRALATSVAYIPLFLGLHAAIGPRVKVILWSGRFVTCVLCPAVAVWGVLNERASLRTADLVFAFAFVLLPLFCWEILITASKRSLAAPSPG